MNTITTSVTSIDWLASLRDPYLDLGAVLARIPSAAQEFRTELAATGTPELVDTRSLITLPYPTRFGLWRASRSLAPFVSITNRMLIIRWRDDDDQLRTLLFEPSDTELGANTPYFATLADRTPSIASNVMVRRHGDVLSHLCAAGIDPSEVDFLAFDHLHTQDVRRWLGTTTPQPDLGAVQPIEPAFPNARLLVQHSELRALNHLHPQQRPWYQPDTYPDLRRDKVVAINGDILLGPGVALVATPGHTTGNQTLFLNTTTGIWASSENAIAAECLVPQHSKLLGVRRWASAWSQDVVVNANTIESVVVQYNSLMLEKAIVDPSQAMSDSHSTSPPANSPDVGPIREPRRHSSTNASAIGARRSQPPRRVDERTPTRTTSNPGGATQRSRAEAARRCR